MTTHCHSPRLGAGPAPKVQSIPRLQTSPEPAWLQIAAWLEWTDAQWETFCWQLAEQNPWLHVSPNPAFHAALPVMDPQVLVTDPWQDIDWTISLSQVARDLPSIELRHAFQIWTASLDHHGLVQRSVAEVARMAGVPASVAGEALAALQALEPVGIGARTVAEAVRLQLQRKGLDGAAERAVLALPMAAWLREPSWLAHKLHIAVSEVEAALVRIRECRPYAEISEKVNAPPLLPKAQLWAHWEEPENTWTISVNDPYELDWQPKPRTPVQWSGDARQAQEQAQAVAIAMRRRREVLVAVTAAVLKAQTAYCLGDASCPRPLTVEMVAEASHVHPSTVHRVMRARWASVPRGTVRLKALVPGGATEKVSAHERIRYWIDQGVTSDRMLSERLEQEGFCVARRTVAKWRRELGLAPPRSHQRRREHV